jgi:hypothetical protein
LAFEQNFNIETIFLKSNLKDADYALFL